MTVKVVENSEVTPSNSWYGLEYTRPGNYATTIINSSDMSEDGEDIDFEASGEDNFLKLKRLNNSTVEFVDFRTNDIMIKRLTITNIDGTDLYIDPYKTFDLLYADSLETYGDYNNKGPIILKAGNCWTTMWQGSQDIRLYTTDSADTFFSVTAEW